MQNRYSLKGRTNLLKAFAFVLGVMFCGSTIAQAQRPQIPQLSLIARPNPNSTGNGTEYPDDRIYVPKAVNVNSEPREILVPVFIKNCFTNGIDPRFNAPPIYSFQFKVQYDERIFRAVGVERFGPMPSDVNSLAKEFDLSFDDAEDDSYQTSLGVTTPNRFFGRRIRISGASTKPLPPTGGAGITNVFDSTIDCNSREFQELLYIRFRVVGTSSGIGTTNTPIIITNDTLRYNDLDVATESPFPGTAEYPSPNGSDPNRGLAGLDRLTNPTEPTKPGVIYAVITDIPRFSFLPNVGLNAKVRQNSETEWELVNPIVVEDGRPVVPNAGGRGTQEINVIADPTISFTRLTDITVESSAKWLKFMTFLKAGVTPAKNPIPSATRFGEINYIDNGILGPGGPGFENADQTVRTQKDPLLNFRIVVDPSQLTPNIKDGLDASGIYVGYITFKSASAEYSPVRLKVTYINVRRPNEPNGTAGRGIRFQLSRVGLSPATSTLLIGTGLRATDGVDTLFGEFAYPDPLSTSTFGARLFPESTTYIDANGVERFRFPFGDTDTMNLYENYRRSYLQALANGFGDLTGDNASRDIRNINADSTLVYRVRFERGAGFSTSQVTITYDTEDFPAEGQIYIRDVNNGTRFSYDLRSDGTSIGNTRRTITIDDPSVREFVIEYTLPKVIDYPVIEKGWNLLSLPVRPSSDSWDAIYPNRLTELPIIYSKGIYQDAAFPRVGIGYFVEYGTLIDTRISGTRLLRIDERDSVLITEGWNTIGSLSVPVSIENIGFRQYSTSALPQRSGAVYGYRTDRGYVEVSELVPGLGYWLRVRGGSGYLRLIAEGRGSATTVTNRNEIFANSAKVSITDGSHNGELYIANTAVNAESFELPPVPPANLFDVRFTNNAILTSEEAAIRLQGVNYPVNVTVENSNVRYTVVNAATGEVLGTAGMGASVQISDKKVRTIKLLSNEVNATGSELSVTPNPIAAQGKITYTVPEAGNVTVKVYDMLGREIETLVNGFVAAGQQPLTFDASALPNGQYMVKMIAGETVVVRTITVNH